MHTQHGEYLLRGMIAVTILLPTMLLGVSERSAALTLVSLTAIVVSWYVTDARDRFHLRQSVADFVALGVVVVTAINAYDKDRHIQLLAVADLQSYLQYVLLFQPKTPRVYWQLAVLSLGQLAVTSTLISGPLFGIVLIVYLTSGVVAFALLLLRTERTRFTAAGSHPGTGSGGFAMLGAAPVLIGGAATVKVREIAGGLLRQSALISAVTVVVGALLFFLLPRRDIPNREVATREPLHSVGFSKTVTLGELGQVVQNPEVVMRIQFFHGDEQAAFKLAGEPLLRGTVVTHYEDGKWTQPRSGSSVTIPVEAQSRFVRQRITAEPLDVAELCCVFPAFGLQSDPRIRMTADRDQLIRHEDFRDGELRLEIGTTGIVDNTQRTIIPCPTRFRSMQPNRGLLQMPERDESEPDRLAGLRAVAERILREGDINPLDRLAAARALNAYLGSSGKFEYSLTRPPRDGSLDPLEDFVTRHPVGHCEYFAGALVMLLRSQGIPARMAIGFKGGEWNSLGSYYQVQQLHAHTWVEVYLDRRDIPADALLDDEHSPGAWLVLDPTEGTQPATPTANRLGILAAWDQYLDYTRVLWANYILGWNNRRQENSLYAPLASAARQAVTTVVSPQAWRSRLRALGNSQLGTFWEWYRRHWFSWRGGLVAVGFSLVVLALVWSARRALGVLEWLGLVRRRRDDEASPVLEIYRRLETALAKRGLRRHPAQTAYEFASVAGAELAESIEHRRVAHLPRRIVEAFYRVRFGGRALDNLEADGVEHALAELELALREKRTPEFTARP